MRVVEGVTLGRAYQSPDRGTADLVFVRLCACCGTSQTGLPLSEPRLGTDCRTRYHACVRVRVVERVKVGCAYQSTLCLCVRVHLYIK